jgi:hypothetical protein
MEGIAGQFVSLPLVREASFIAGAKFFGYQGIEIWYAPIPIHNYGEATVNFRKIELTGTSIRGIIKAEIVVFPVVMVASLLFSQFIWRLAPIPSSSYPYAQELWHLQALNTLLMQTSTLEGDSFFFQALNGGYVLSGMVFGIVTYGLLTLLGLPVLLVYGVVRGLGQTTPHGLILEVTVRIDVAPICSRFVGWLLLRDGPYRDVGYGSDLDSKVADTLGILII